MASSDLLSIGSSGLYAAQAALATTSHNIANANTPGYSRQVVVQSNLPPQAFGAVGYVGTGTQVAQIKRVYDSFMTSQVNAAQANASQLDAYNTQISQIDNMLGDTTAGLSPTLQDFFAGVNDLSANPSSAASRQTFLSDASALTSRFQSLAGQLNDINTGVNTQITSTVAVVNSYAQQIAVLNGQISAMSSSTSDQPNDLLDQRDELVTELNKYVKATATVGDNNSLTVTIANGQPLVTGNVASQLAAVQSPTKPDQLQVAFVSGSRSSTLSDSSITGGLLGGLMQFRSDTLTSAENQLGAVAATLATAFNNQNQLGQDNNGDLGQPLFTLPPVTGVGSTLNNPTSDTAIKATISDTTKLTASDYNVKYDGVNFVVTRESDGAKTTIDPYPQTVPQTIDGVDFSISGTTAAAGDSYEVRPTNGAAAGISVAITDPDKIATGVPISTAVGTANTGKATISPGTIDKTYAGNPLTAPVTLTYAANDPTTPSAGGTLNFDPATQDVTVTDSTGTATVYPAGTPVPYSTGSQISVGGVNLAITGTPANNDTFTISPNSSGVGDNRNAAAMAALQTANLMKGGTATLQGSYAQLVSFVGNNARAAQVNGAAADTLLTTVTTSQQNVSGVNLDEEAANLLRFQQAYQASGKVIQIASTLFNTLLSLGGN
jgi:flagellar hook-associated protein 1 FlgK